MRIPAVGRIKDEACDAPSSRSGQRGGKGRGVAKDDRATVRLPVYGPFEVRFCPVHHHRIKVHAHGFSTCEGSFDEETACAGHRVEQNAVA